MLAVKLGNHQEALGSFEQALDMAQVQGDKAAEAAIRKAMEDVNQRIVQGIKSGEKGLYFGKMGWHFLCLHH